MLQGLKSLFGFTERKTLDLDGLLYAGASYPGPTVSPEAALQCPAVLGAVKVLAETFAALPTKLYRRDDARGLVPAMDHPLWTLLTDAPNAWTPAAEFRLIMASNLALWGNAYAFANRDSSGALVELIALDPRTVMLDPTPATFEPVYRVTTPDGATAEYGRDQILHIRSVGIFPHVGVSPLAEAREAIGLAILLEQFASSLFARGARPSGLLTTTRAVSTETLKRLRQSFEELYKGASNAGRTAILEEGMAFQPFQISSVDAQFLELRRFQLGEIARALRIPLHMLAELDRTTHSNAEELGAEFLTYCILPLVRLWEGAMSLSLLTPEERKTLTISFDLDELARADFLARYQAYSTAIAAGVLSPNEARERENLAPYPGGDTFMRPLNQGEVGGDHVVA